MRFLNKVIFINSADKSLPYAEVNLDGNVHFIGTQGVGKSTLLRAILFFYNADKLKLGISKEKKSFDEYYFPYQNSYIIYEVVKETGPFCIIAFKAQGRVAFRFFDSAYNKKFFIDNDGLVFPHWEQTRDALGKHIRYTKIIHSYEEFRNIIYGNNQGLAPEFRKYAVLESKNYQNIPRTITNVFLNSKLDAEFIKETIIKSLNEDDISINLTTYSQNHLKDFETNLEDIKKWTETNKQGENLLQKQAIKVADTYSALKFLEKDQLKYSKQLGWAVQIAKNELPKAQKNAELEEAEKAKLLSRIARTEEIFKEKTLKINKELNVVESKLADIKIKEKYYAEINLQDSRFTIEQLIERVSKRKILEEERENLIQEMQILTSQNLENTAKYEALLKQLENQLQQFENNKQTEKANARENFLQHKEKLTAQFEKIYEEIKKQNAEALLVARNIAEDKNSLLTHLKIRKAEAKNKRFFEAEIETVKSEISVLQASIIKMENESKQAKANIQNLQREGDFEEKNLKNETNRKITFENEKLTNKQRQISAIETKLENSKNSLYQWLNENIEGWENTIGKVIDEENVLFMQGLNPVKNASTTHDLFGVKIDLDAIEKPVKTIADYEFEKAEIQKQILKIQKSIAEIKVALDEDLQRLKNRFQPKIKAEKEIISNNDYNIEQAKFKLDEATVKLNSFKEKVQTEKQAVLKKIETEIGKLNEELISAKEEITKVEQNINKLISAKKKEKEIQEKDALAKYNIKAEKIENEIISEQKNIAKKQTELKEKHRNELANKGVDTSRISAIEKRVSEIVEEIKFIENANIKVVEYEKDKRELFDFEDEFKNNKKLSENKLETEKQKHLQQKEKLNAELENLLLFLEESKEKVEILKEDLQDFEQFKLSEIYANVEFIISEFTAEDKSNSGCKNLIEILKQNYYSQKDRLNDLQEAVNKFVGNFSENNIFSFKTKFISKADFFVFAEMLKEFLEEDKIAEYKRRVEERFAHIISKIGKETQSLIEKEGEIHEVIREINRDFVARNFVGAIKSMELRTVPSANKIFQLLVEIKRFNDENAASLGAANLFSSDKQESKNEKAVSYLKQLIKEMAAGKEKEITLSDSFELQFRIVENDNDTDWVEKLANVGSDGTDILVKAMINIMLLNVFKERAAKKQKIDFRLHCMMDEVGKLHPTNVKGILKFANDRNILLTNSSPTTFNAIDYRYTYLLSKDGKNTTTVKRLVSKNPTSQTETSRNYNEVAVTNS